MWILRLVASALFLLALPGLALPRPVTSDLARLTAQRHLLDQPGHGQGWSIQDVDATPSGLAHVVRLSPTGYVVVSADERLPPVLAYSRQAGFGALDPALNPLLDLIEADLAGRKAHLELVAEPVRRARRAEWQRLRTGAAREGERTDYWPPEGSTSTGGWIEVRWGQGAPYNAFCPLDAVSGNRSVAGCPAVAMAQLLTLHRDTRGTRFEAGDRYYHNYGGNQYWIDDAWESYDFPRFPDLNTHLDTLDAHWAAGTSLTVTDKAALVFACGVAARQVYHPQGSGTFGVNQAFTAWQRFGYGEARLLGPSNAAVYSILAQNMMNGHPAHLAVVTPTWNAGHNVVVDGWNSDGFFHLNFGWGGPYDGWYLLPDEMPYNLTVLEGVIVDLIPQETSLPPRRERQPQWALAAWPNPCNPLLTLSFDLALPGQVELDLLNLLGQRVATLHQGMLGAGRHHLPWTPVVASGVYLARLRHLDTGAQAIRRVVVAK
ncbi:MAG: C10 family peptidase [bacterium]|jgi:hypothetical protein|nr:C10 family peptidase [bacterium]